MELTSFPVNFQGARRFDGERLVNRLVLLELPFELDRLGFLRCGGGEQGQNEAGGGGPAAGQHSIILLDPGPRQASNWPSYRDGREKQGIVEDFGRMNGSSYPRSYSAALAEATTDAANRLDQVRITR